MLSLLVARHGEADWNVERRWLGHSDRPLTERGRAQAQLLAHTLSDSAIDAAYASNLARAVDTARIALHDRAIDLVRWPALRERRLGAWEGVADDDVPGRYPEEYARWIAGDGDGAHDAEPYASFVDRVRSSVASVAGRHPKGTVLLVTHSGFMRVLYALARGMDFVTVRRTIPEPPHATVVRYAVDARGLRPVDEPVR